MDYDKYTDYEPIEVVEDEKKSNWMFVIIFAVVYCLIGVGVGFIVSATTNDFRYTEIITALLCVLILLFMMVRIWFRSSHNLKKGDKSVFEDKKTLSYKNWFRLQMCFLFTGIFLILLSQLFFFIFIYSA